jgi:hypothetical protein
VSDLTAAKKDDAQTAAEMALHLFCNEKNTEVNLVWSIGDLLYELRDASADVAHALEGKKNIWLMKLPKELA